MPPKACATLLTIAFAGDGVDACLLFADMGAEDTDFWAGGVTDLEVDLVAGVCVDLI